MTQVDDMFINYYDSKKVKRILTPDGYTIDKEGYSIFGVTLAEAEEGGKKVSAQLSDIKTGAERGFAKLAEGTGSLALAGLEKLNFISDGSVEKFGEFFAKEVYPRIGETETLAGGLTEGISQFLVPGVGYYKLFGALMTVPKNASRIKKFVNSVGRVTAAEGAAVGTAQVAGDPNFASFLNEFLNIDQKLAEGITKDFAVYLTTPETSKDADAVLREKLKATIADTPVAYAAEGLMAFAKILKGIKGDPKIEEEVFDINNPPPGAIEEPMPQRGDPDFEETVTDPNADIKQELNDDITAQLKMDDVSSLFNTITKNPEGFSVTINGKTPADLGYEGGYMVAPLKQTEIVFDSKTFSNADVEKLLDNVEALEKTLDGRYAEVYAGGWLENGKYYLDASVRIDNLDDALYIAQSGNQLGIFDLKEFKTIDTKEGIEQLKQTGSYSSTKDSKQRAETKAIGEGFEKARMETEGGSE